MTVEVGATMRSHEPMGRLLLASSTKADSNYSFIDRREPIKTAIGKSATSALMASRSATAAPNHSMRRSCDASVLPRHTIGTSTVTVSLKWLGCNMLKRLFKRRYNAEKNWRYHNALRSCQVAGIRMGTASRNDGVWVYYWEDGKFWRFRQGRVVGPLPFDGTLWRSMQGGMRHSSLSLRRFIKLC